MQERHSSHDYPPLLSLFASAATHSRYPLSIILSTPQ